MVGTPLLLESIDGVVMRHGRDSPYYCSLDGVVMRHGRNWSTTTAYRWSSDEAWEGLPLLMKSRWSCDEAW